MTDADLVAHARAPLDTNRNLVLGTVDAMGRPWTSPVHFAATGERELYWVSATDAQHSRNLAGRPQVSIVVFDSTVAPYHGRAVYAAGEAQELSGDELEREPRQPCPLHGISQDHRAHVRSGRPSGR